MKSIHHQTIKKFFEIASKKLEGEWIMIGGTVLIGLNREIRSTTDIDIVSKDAGDTSQALELMEIAEQLGLPVETINQAGAYFLKKIKNYQEYLLPLYSKNKFIVYRPNFYLFVLLKVPRLSESDLADCLEYFKYANEKNEEFDLKLTLGALKTEMKKNDHRASRIEVLYSKISGDKKR